MTASDGDLIRRGDARRVVLAYASSYSAQAAENAINALPAEARVAELEAALATARAEAIREAVSMCCPHEDDDALDRMAKAECASATLALLDTPAPAPVTVEQAARVLLDGLGDFDRDRSHPAFDMAFRAQTDSRNPAPFNQIGDGLIAALRALAGDRT